MTDTELLAEAKNPDGSRRFYPPGQHPATARLRAHIEALEAFPASEERDKALAHAREQLANFARIEYRAQRNYLRMVRK